MPNMNVNAIITECAFFSFLVSPSFFFCVDRIFYFSCYIFTCVEYFFFGSFDSSYIHIVTRTLLPFYATHTDHTLQYRNNIISNSTISLPLQSGPFLNGKTICTHGRTLSIQNPIERILMVF